MKKRILLTLIPTLLIAGASFLGVSNINNYKEVTEITTVEDSSELSLPVVGLRKSGETTRFTTASVSLTDDIILKITPSLEGLEYESYEMEFDLNGVKTTVSAVDGIFSYTGVAPQYISNKLTITLYGIKEERTALETKDYSVKDYLLSVLAKTTDETLTNNELSACKDLASDVLRYGEEAQKFTSTNLDNLATSGAEIDNYGSALDTTIANKYALEGEQTTANWNGARLWFASKLGLDYRFVSNTQLTELSVKVLIGEYETTINSESITETIDGTEYAYTFRVTEFSALSFYQGIKTTVYSGNEQISKTLTYGVNTYISNMSNKEIESLAKAVYKYGKSAYLYKNINSVNLLEDGISFTREDYTYNLFTDYEFDGTKYYVTDENGKYKVEYNVDISNDRTILYVTTPSGSNVYNAYNLPENISYNPITNEYTYTLNENLDYLNMASLADVELNVASEVTVGQIKYENNDTDFSITGQKLTLNKTLISQAKTTTIDGYVEIAISEAQDGYNFNGGAGVLNITENGSLNIYSTTGNTIDGKSGMYLNKIDNKGTLNVKNYQYVVNFAHTENGGGITSSGNLIVEGTRCIIGTGTQEFNFSGTVNINASEFAIYKGALRLIDGNINIASTFGWGDLSTILASEVIVGTKTTSPIVNIRTAAAPALTNHKPARYFNEWYTEAEDNTGTANYQFVNGTTTITSTSGGGKGIYAHSDGDTISISEDARLIISNVEYGIDGNGSTNTSLLSNGYVNITSSKETARNINSLLIKEGKFKATSNNGNGMSNIDKIEVGTELTSAILNVQSKEWGIYSDNANKEWNFINGAAIFTHRDSDANPKARGYAALNVTNGVSSLKICKDFKLGTKYYSYAIYKTDGNISLTEITGSIHALDYQGSFCTEGVNGEGAYWDNVDPHKLQYTDVDDATKATNEAKFDEVFSSYYIND